MHIVDMYNRTVWGLLLLLVVVITIVYYYGNQEGFFVDTISSVVVGGTDTVPCPTVLQSIENGNKMLFDADTGILKTTTGVKGSSTGNPSWSPFSTLPISTGVTLKKPYKLMLGVNGVLWIQDSTDAITPPVTSATQVIAPPYVIWSSTQTNPVIQSLTTVKAIVAQGAGGPYLLRLQNDGNLCIVDKSKAIVWGKPMIPKTPVSDTCLLSNDTDTCSAAISSPNNNCTLSLDTSTGILTLKDYTGTTKWQNLEMPPERSGHTYSLKIDTSAGRLYVINDVAPNPTKIWMTPLPTITNGAPYQLVVSDNCTLTLYDKTSTVLWSASIPTNQPYAPSTNQPDSSNDTSHWNSLDDSLNTSVTGANRNNMERVDIVPHTNVSDTTVKATSLQQKSKFLQEIQKMIHNEFLASRTTTHVNEPDEDEDADASSCTSATMQGNEYANKRPSDMSPYIRKDSIPCAGCTLDY